MKLGISVKIDVTKIDKARLFTGKNGNKYLDMTTFVDLDNPSQYGDHGFISQDVSKEERQQGVKGNILGNCKVFYNDTQTTQQQVGGFQQQAPQQPQGTPRYGQGGPTPPAQGMEFDDDIAF